MQNPNTFVIVYSPSIHCQKIKIKIAYVALPFIHVCDNSTLSNFGHKAYIFIRYD